MPTIDVLDARGQVVGRRELPADLFERPVNVPLMHQVVVAGLAAQRAGTHATRTRGQVSGGGVKPWRQKGTGRARHGSIRSPIWTGGGVAHGPTPRDHSVRVNKKMRKAALRSALSDATASGKLAVVQGLAFDGPRTKDAVAVLDALGVAGRVLLVIERPDEGIEKSFRNLGYVKIDYPGNLSTYDVLYADRVVFTAAAVDALAARGQEREGGGAPPLEESETEPATGGGGDATLPEEAGHPEASGPEGEELDREAAVAEEAGE